MKTGSLTKNYAYYTSTNKVKNTDGSGNDYTYDGNGNTLTDVFNGVTMTYDFMDMPVTLTKNSVTTNYTYHGGTRVKKQTGTDQPVYYIWGLAEYTGTTISAFNTAYGKINVNSGIVSKYYFISDHVGSVRAIVDKNGALVEYSDYYAFGALLAGRSISVINADEQFNGKKLDAESGFLFYGARYYNSRTGRWMVSDPADQFHSPYVFSGNCPVMMQDRDGKWAWLIPFIISGSFNAVLNGDKIHNGLDFAKYFGIGGAIGYMSYASAGGGLAGLDQFSQTFMANQTWNMAYNQSGLSNLVRKKFGDELNWGLNLFGPNLIQQQIANTEGLADGVTHRRIQGPESEQIIKDFGNKYPNRKLVDGGQAHKKDTKWLPGLTEISYYGKPIGYVREKYASSNFNIFGLPVLGYHTAPIPFGELSNDYIPNIAEDKTFIGPLSQYGFSGICHNPTTDLLGYKAGRSFLPSQVLPYRASTGFYQSIYGGGTLNGALFFNFVLPNIIRN